MRFIQKIGAGFVAAAMASAVAMPAMAFAATDENGAATELDKAYLTKVIKADQEIGVYTSADAYTFDFVPATDSSEKAAVPATAFGSITKTIAASDANYTDTTQSAIAQLSLDNVFKASDYSRAGVYNYVATENDALATGIQGATVKETGAVQTYLVKVYVVNNGDQLKIEGVGVYVNPTFTTDTETHTIVIETPGEEKADPTKTEEEISEEVTHVNTEGAGEYDGFVFENTYTQSGTLAVTKVVTNKNAGADYADRSLAWNFTTELTLPANYTADQAREVAAELTAGDKNFTATADGNKVTVKFALNGGKSATDNDSITLANVPVGTAYAVTEDAKTANSMPAGWEQTQTAEVSAKVPTAGAAASITNQFDDQKVTPTGILINNLPYILLVGIPVVALLAWFTMRRRNMELED